MRIFYILKSILRKLNNSCYEDLTNSVKKNSDPIKNIDRKLSYSIDYNGNKHYDYFFEKIPKKMLDEEKKYRQILESLLKHKVYRNPKPKGDGFRSADFIVENLNESWDVKGLDGKSKSLIENTLGNACKKRQAPYLMLHKRNTPKKLGH